MPSNESDRTIRDGRFAHPASSNGHISSDATLRDGRQHIVGQQSQTLQKRPLPVEDDDEDNEDNEDPEDDEDDEDDEGTRYVIHCLHS